LELFHVKRYMSGMEHFDVQLIPQGAGRWTALLVGGSVLVLETSRPAPDVATALLRLGADPRSTMVIRAGARVVAKGALTYAAGGADCSDADGYSALNHLNQ
jgi:hypothetical protein